MVFRLRLAFCMPPTHPFNPIKALRLARALESRLDVIHAIYDFIWAEGRDPSDPAEFAVLCERVGLRDLSLIEAPAIKQNLRDNTERALSLQVFGVPTGVYRGALFWGEDAGPMLAWCMHNPDWLDSAELQRISTLPVGVRRV